MKEELLIYLPKIIVFYQCKGRLLDVLFGLLFSKTRWHYPTTAKLVSHILQIGIMFAS